MSARTWVNSLDELAKELGYEARTSIQRWVQMEDWPEKTGRGWYVPGAMEFIKSKKEESGRGIKGRDVDLKRHKLQLECDMLDEKLAALRGESIPLDEHHSELADVVSWLKGGMEEWLQKVAATFKDAEVFEMAEKVRDSVLKKLATLEGID